MKYQDVLQRILNHRTSLNPRYSLRGLEVSQRLGLKGNERSFFLLSITALLETPQRDGESPWFTQFVDCVGNQWGLEER